jgi:phage/plasmid-like protein (TIGR03299 family)
MAHLVETMAYAGQVPWHGLGERVPADLSPRQMMRKAGVDWEVHKVPTYAAMEGEDLISTGSSALIRSSDKKVLAPMVGEGWEPVQNSEAFDFFTEYCSAGDMEMHTAGSLNDGKMVWALAKVNESFDVLGEDRVDSYLLFSNPHQYGKSLNVRFTPIRVVCNNTLTMSLSATSKNEVALNHRRAFDPSMVKEQLGIAHEKFEVYKDASRFLASKRISKTDLVTYMNNVFEFGKTKGREVTKYEDLPRTAKAAFDVLESQPGANFAEGSYWQAFNAVTYLTDHELGRNADTRLQSAWFGVNQQRKVRAMNLALEMAEAA